MSNRTLVITTLLALLASGLAWLTRPTIADLTRADEGPAEIGLGLDPASIRRVTIEAATEDPGSPTISAELTRNETGHPDGAGWTLALPSTEDSAARWPADPEAVRSLLTDLVTLGFRPNDAAQEQAPSATPAGRPLASVTIESPSSITTLELTAPPLGGRIPATLRTAGDGETTPRTGSVDASRLRPSAPQDLASLAAPYPFRGQGGNSGVITGLGIASNETGFVVVRRAGLWELDRGDTGSPSPRLDQRAVSALIDALGAIRMTGVSLPYKPPAPESETIQLSVTTEFPRRSDGQARRTTTTLRVLGQSSIEGDADAVVNRVYMRNQPGPDDGSADQSVRMTLTAQTFPTLPATVAPLLDAVPLPWPSDETGRVGFLPNQSDQGLTYTRTLSGWNNDTEPDRPVERTALGALLSLLASPQAASLDDSGFLEGFEQVSRACCPSIVVSPIGTGSPVKLWTKQLDETVRITDGATVWTLDDPEGVFKAAWEQLGPESTSRLYRP